jgi:hypothetical protein
MAASGMPDVSTVNGELVMCKHVYVEKIAACKVTRQIRGGSSTRNGKEEIQNAPRREEF